MSDRRPDKGRHQARKRAVDLLFEAEARGLTPAEVADSRNAVGGDADSEVFALNPYTVTVTAESPSTPLTSTSSSPRTCRAGRWNGCLRSTARS